MDVADDVEGAGEVGQVVEALLGDDGGVLDVRDAAQDVHLAEALALQAADRSPQFTDVALDDPDRHVGPVGAGRVALGAHLLGHVEDDGDGQHVVLLRQVDQLPPAVLLHTRRVDDRATAGGQALARDVVQDVEGVLRRATVVLVVGDQAPAEVRGDHLGRLEVPAGEGGLAGTRGADEDDEGEVGDGKSPSCALDLGHAAFASFSVLITAVLTSKMAICVGGPTSGSSGPTGLNSTS